MKVYLVTGAASGIGAALARALLARGAAVCAADIQPMNALAGDPARLLSARLDVRDAQAWTALVERVVARWGRLDVLLNVAGVLKPGYVQETTAADVDFHIDVNLKGVIHGTRAAAQQM
ncbi:MAG TPA: SDR family NAD(P)-dependent oxidoreductase, partial [Nevskiales bacterium]|nr:SDR family NAD(P)-dependent oxidoreductase [Nevskiales bacterium]